MTRRLIALIGVLALCLGTLATPASAQVGPASSEAACLNANGVYTPGTPSDPVVEGPTVDGTTRTTVSTTTTIDTCVITTITDTRENTAHKNFAVDFETTTVETDATTTTETTTTVDMWEIVGNEPETVVVTGWGCFNPGGDIVRGPWGDGTGDPSTGAPSQIQCNAALAAYPNATSIGWVIKQATTTVPGADIYDWVLGTPETTSSAVDAAPEITSSEAVIGCFNLVSGTYLDSINAHCQATITRHQ